MIAFCLLLKYKLLTGFSQTLIDLNLVTSSLQLFYFYTNLKINCKFPFNYFCIFKLNKLLRLSF